MKVLIREINNYNIFSWIYVYKRLFFNVFSQCIVSMHCLNVYFKCIVWMYILNVYIYREITIMKWLNNIVCGDCGDFPTKKIIYLKYEWYSHSYLSYVINNNYL